MKMKSFTDVPRLRDVRGSSEPMYPDRLRVKSFDAFLSWELLQRGVAHNTKPMSDAEITLLCGGSASLPSEIQHCVQTNICGEHV